MAGAGGNWGNVGREGEGISIRLTDCRGGEGGAGSRNAPAPYLLLNLHS